MSHRPTASDLEMAKMLRDRAAAQGAAPSAHDYKLPQALSQSLRSAEPEGQPAQATGLYVYTAIPDRWCFKCQRERPSVYCVICRNATRKIVEIDPRDIKPRSRLGKIFDRFKLARMQRRR